MGRFNARPYPRKPCPHCGKSTAYFVSTSTFKHHGRPFCRGSGAHIDAEPVDLMANLRASIDRAKAQRRDSEK